MTASVTQATAEAKVVPADSLLRLQRVEALVVDQAPIGDLPGADVDTRDVKTLVRPGGSD